MNIEIGKRYWDGRENSHLIAGITKHCDTWYWSIDGNWYTDTGKLIRFNADDGSKYWIEESTYNLVREEK